MKTLQVNKFYHTVGGASRYFLELSKLLERNKHKLAIFSMNHPRNNSSQWEKYFLSNISLEKINYRNILKVLERTIYSFEARDKIERLIEEFTPQIIHLHSLYHYISPSVILSIHQKNIPVVQSLADYHLVSPNYHLFHNRKICEITKKNEFYKAIFHKCIRNSYLDSLVEVIEKYLHHYLGWEKKYIDYFIVPSEFIKTKFIEYGISKEKIIFLPYFINYHEYTPNFVGGNYILYFGRLSPEKGINYLIKTMKLLPKIKLLIVGRGDQEKELRIMNKELGIKNVEFVGFKDGYELKKLIANSRFTILPSVWYEVFGLSILESFASGKPVIASNIGGIPETVKDGYNGFLFEPGNVSDCAEKINKLWNDSVLCRKLGRNARDYVEHHFGPEEHYERLMEIYRKAIEKHK